MTTPAEGTTAPATEALDLDMLSQPAGFDDGGNVPLTRTKPAPETPAATPTNPAPAAATPPATEPATTPAAQGNAPAVKEPVTPASAAAASDIRADLQARLTTKFGADFKLPEAVNKDNFDDYLIGLGRATLHPEAARLQSAIEKGLKPEDYYAQRGHLDAQLKLDDKTLVHQHYKGKYGKSDARPQGLEDAKIDELVQRKEERGDLMLEAIELREVLQKQKEEQAQKELDWSQGRSEDKIPDFADPVVRKQFRADLEQEANAVLVDNGKALGIDLSKPEVKAKYMEHLEGLFVPDKTGASITVQRIRANGGMLKVGILLDMLESGALDARVQQQANSVHEMYIKELSLRPPTSSGQAPAREGEIDINRASRPSQFFEGDK